MVFIFIVERLFYNYYIQKHYLVNDFARSRLPFRQKFQCKKALAKLKLFDKVRGVSYIVFVCGYGEMADAAGDWPAGITKYREGSNPSGSKFIMKRM